MNARLRLVVPSVVFMALIGTSPAARADEVSGRTLARQAQQALAEGNPDRAIELMERARIEWPGAPVVAHTMADARYRQGDYAAAMAEYDKGSGGAFAFRAFFNQGVTLNALAESGLSEAAVPLDPVGIPADVDPGPMIEAIDKGLKTLEFARGHFLDALADSSDSKAGQPTAARESVAAINRRMDDLREMKEELEKLQEEQEGDDEQESEDEENEDGEQGEDGEQQQDQDQEQDDENQDSEDSEGNPDEQQGEDDEPQEPTEPQEAEPVPGQQTQLSPQEMVKLLEQLEQLEERARAMQRIRRAQQRKSVERDW